MLEISQIANLSCILNSKKIPANFNVYVACSCSPLSISSPISLPRCFGVYGLWGRKKRGETQKKRENLGKLTDELKQKMFISLNASIKVLFATKDSRFAPTTNVVVLYYNLFEMPIWFGIEFLPAFRCKSSTPKEVRRSYVSWRQFKCCDDLEYVRWRQTKGISTQDGIVASLVSFLLFLSDITDPAKITNLRLHFIVFFFSAFVAKCHASI